MNDKIIELYSAGNSIKNIAKELNCSKQKVKTILLENKIQIRNKGNPKGHVPWNIGVKFLDDSINMSQQLIESGEIFKLSETAIRKHVKRYLISKQGNKCSICGTEIWNNKPVPLVCDHINGNHKDNNLENFRIVCYNCDAQLPTFKSKNRGNGRTYDREYRRRKVEEFNGKQTDQGVGADC